jgi:hypothetical protein
LLGDSAILYPEYSIILILFAAHKWLFNHFTFPALIRYATISLSFFLICFLHFGNFCIDYNLTRSCCIGLRILNGIRYLLCDMARLRTVLGRDWKLRLLDSTWRREVNLIIYELRWARNLLKFKYLYSVFYLIIIYHLLLINIK